MKKTDGARAEALKLALHLDGLRGPAWMLAMAAGIAAVEDEAAACQAVRYAKAAEAPGSEMRKGAGLAYGVNITADWPPAAMLDWAFDWTLTAEGHHYWRRVHQQLGGQRARVEYERRTRLVELRDLL